MTMWNEHLAKYIGLGQDDLTRMLLGFVKSHSNVVSDQCVYGIFVCHVTRLN